MQIAVIEWSFSARQTRINHREHEDHGDAGGIDTPGCSFMVVPGAQAFDNDVGAGKWPGVAGECSTGGNGASKRG